MANEAPAAPAPASAPAAPASTPAPAAPAAPPAPQGNPPAAGEPSLLGGAGQPAAGAKPQTPGTESPKPGEQPGAAAAPWKMDEIKLPEGVALDKEAGEAFYKLATESKLDKDTTQKLVDFQVGREQAMQKALSTDFESTVKTWREETKKEYGNDYDKASADAGKFIETFGSPELRQLLDATRVGENKHLFRAFAEAGKRLGEGKFTGGKPAGSEKTLAELWYPNEAKK